MSSTARGQQVTNSPELHVPTMLCRLPPLAVVTTLNVLFSPKHELFSVQRRSFKTYRKTLKSQNIVNFLRFHLEIRGEVSRVDN